ncbi:MAG: cisplatin damage response ATP-dependent DNA ligase [Saprospiraceae bacterium]|nr:cisplatin damage response ATP-dependent DNA ligase [Saprospiraceae bacterium]
MKAFTRLYLELDKTSEDSERETALVRYFDQAADPDKLWVIALLSGQRPKRICSISLLREWVEEAAGIPSWLFEEGQKVVGDLAETIALSLPFPVQENSLRLSEWIKLIQRLGNEAETKQKQAILEAWDQLDPPRRFVFNKLISGGFRMDVAPTILTGALALHTGIEGNKIAQRLSANWSPDESSFENLILTEHALEDISRPFPFSLLRLLEGSVSDLGDFSDWMAGYKLGGLRAQLIKRDGEVFLWSEANELITPKFPEFDHLKTLLPDGIVLDGDIIPYKEDWPLPIHELHARISKKKLSRNIMEQVPVIFMVSDLLELDRTDIRSQPLAQRRVKLEAFFHHVSAESLLRLYPLITAENWIELSHKRTNIREKDSIGLTLQKIDAPYPTTDDYFWKAPPFKVYAVLLYAQSSGDLYREFTFAVWNKEALVPFAKANTGLKTEELQQLNSWIKMHITERFGPVRAVKPELVFEIAFDGIFRSKRHKSGLTLLEPRIVSWEKDKDLKEAHRLADLEALIR